MDTKSSKNKVRCNLLLLYVYKYINQMFTFITSRA